jgi:hypothetical protein
MLTEDRRLSFRQRLPPVQLAAAAALVACSAAACSDGTGERDGLHPGSTLQPSTPALQVGGWESLELSPWFAEDSVLVGIAVDAGGRVYVLEERTGLLRLLVDGSSQLLLDATDLDRRYGLSAAITLTDVVEYGPERFLITAENDGFLLDLWAGTFSSYFCYLPPAPADQAPIVSVSQALAAQGIAVTQRTNSVTHNTLSGQIFAQPQTLRLDPESVEGSELFVFGGWGGEPTSVTALSDLSFSAGGMVARGDRLLLGAGTALSELVSDGTLSVIRTLDPGVDITGMTLDGAGRVFVLDGRNQRLLNLGLILGAAE